MSRRAAAALATRRMREETAEDEDGYRSEEDEDFAVTAGEISGGVSIFRSCACLFPSSLALSATVILCLTYVPAFFSLFFLSLSLFFSFSFYSFFLALSLSLFLSLSFLVPLSFPFPFFLCIDPFIPLHLRLSFLAISLLTLNRQYSFFSFSVPVLHSLLCLSVSLSISLAFFPCS